MPETLPSIGLIAFGSNVGNSQVIYQNAIDQIDALDRVCVTARSRPITTQPVGITGVDNSDQHPYFNAAIRVETLLTPFELLKHLLAIENALGRIRTTRWGSRTIDLDLLLLGNQVICTEDLVLPHPRMTFRRFVLVPSIEIGADLIHPIGGCSIEYFLHCITHRENHIGIVFDSNSKHAGILRQLVDELQKKFSEDKFETFFSEKTFLQKSGDLKLVVCLDDQLEYHASTPNVAGPENVAANNPIRANDTPLSQRDGSTRRLFDRAIHFQGPSIHLTANKDDAWVEICAAMEAMR